MFFAILLTVFFGCETKRNEVNITGKIYGEIPESINYTLPINGVCDYAFKESILPDTLGNFAIKIEIEKPSFVRLFIPGKTNAILLVEQGMNYDVNFNLESKENNIKITCENQKGQDTYNALPNPGHIQLGAKEFFKDSVAVNIKSKLLSLKENEIDLFANLLSDGVISEDFFQLVKLDRECYYSAVQGTVALIKKYEDERLKDGTFSPEIKQMWEESFAETSPMKIALIRSPWYYSLAENYIMYNEYTDDSFDFDKLKEKNAHGLRHTHNIEEAKRYLSSNLLEYYNATYLFTACLQKKYEKELISLFDEFKKDFPNSEYTKYLEPTVSPIVEFQKEKEKPFSENVKFVDGYEGINSLKESVSSLKGKKVYVDVWATWCGPCKKEFEHKAQLKKLLASKNMEILYISIDRDENESQWKDMIKFYGLEGYHVRANQELNEDLRKIFNRNGSISIPWYLIIDANGNVIEKHASRPSQLNELENELIKH